MVSILCVVWFKTFLFTVDSKMNKTDFYLSRCLEAASKSPMTFTLGAILVKGGKVVSTGWNHCRTNYDGNDVQTRGYRKPISMHAEMHAIFNLTGGMSPSFKAQKMGSEQRVSRPPDLSSDSSGAEADSLSKSKGSSWPRKNSNGARQQKAQQAIPGQRRQRNQPRDPRRWQLLLRF